MLFRKLLCKLIGHKWRWQPLDNLPGLIERCQRCGLISHVERRAKRRALANPSSRNKGPGSPYVDQRLSHALYNNPVRL